MRIRMLSTERGSIDGVRVTSYEAGQEYDLTATAGERALACAFVGAGLAEEVGAAPPPSSEAEEGGDDASAPAEAATPPQAKTGRKPKAQ